MPNDTALASPLPGERTVAAALAGLSATPKTLPSMLFYDDEGCRLFYEITRQPEYYLTRTEVDLLHKIGSDVFPDDLREAALVEFGGSDETKARILLDQPHSPFNTYVPIDVAGPALSGMQVRLQQTHPRLIVKPVLADFMQPLRLPVLEQSRMGFFPGSTIGNLDPSAAAAFLASARRSLGPESWFLLGADLRKSPRILLPAYNDSAGITAAFNLNLLSRLNREAAANFDLSAFQHQAIWNDKESRIEMHLVSLRDQTVLLGEHRFDFREGESMHTENSYKHTPEKLAIIAGEGGWKVRKVWKDHAGLFGVILLQSA